MKDNERPPKGDAPENGLLEKLSRLKPVSGSERGAPGLEARLLAELKRRRPRLWRRALDSRWTVVLILLLLALLGWDLLRIIRFLFSR